MFLIRTKMVILWHNFEELRSKGEEEGLGKKMLFGDLINTHTTNIYIFNSSLFLGLFKFCSKCVLYVMQINCNQLKTLQT